MASVRSNQIYPPLIIHVGNSDIQNSFAECHTSLPVLRKLSIKVSEVYKVPYLQFYIYFHLLSFTNKITSAVLLTEASASYENDSLRSSVKELSEKLSVIDQSFTLLTNLLKSFVRSSGYPMTAEATHLLEGIEGMCRKKRRAGVTGEFVDLDCEAKEPAKVNDKDFRIPYYGYCNIGEYSDDADSVSDAVTQCSEDKEIPDDHSDADFDSFLAYIAHDRHKCDKDAASASPYSTPLPSSAVVSSDGPEPEWDCCL